MWAILCVSYCTHSLSTQQPRLSQHLWRYYLCTVLGWWEACQYHMKVWTAMGKDAVAQVHIKTHYNHLIITRMIQIVTHTLQYSEMLVPQVAL